MPRRRIRIVLAIAALLVIAAASGFAGLWVGATTGEDAEPGAWSLLGVRDGGRTLVVRGAEHGDCDRTSVTADESDPQRVVIRSMVHEPRGSEACTLALNGGKEFAVRLKRPILGRAVDGRRRKLRPLSVLEQDIDIDEHTNRAGLVSRPLPVPDWPPPNVVGLRFRDARHALCNAGFEARRPRGDRRSGMVVAQHPPVVQGPLRTPGHPTCSNGMRAAVDLEVWSR